MTIDEIIRAALKEDIGDGDHTTLATVPADAKGKVKIVNVIEDMRKNNEDIPEPFSTREFSGKFIVRIPPELHRRIAEEAAEEGVSINRLVNSRLAK